MTNDERVFTKALTLMSAGIQGLGSKKVGILARHFKTFDALRTATRDDIMAMSALRSTAEDIVLALEDTLLCASIQRAIDRDGSFTFYETHVVSSSTGELYTIRLKVDGSTSCTCPGWMFNRYCKHIKGHAAALEMMLDDTDTRPYSLKLGEAAAQAAREAASVATAVEDVTMAMEDDALQTGDGATTHSMTSTAYLLKDSVDALTDSVARAAFVADALVGTLEWEGRNDG